MHSTVGLVIQCVVIVLLTLLSLFMRGSIRNESLKYWTAAWTCLAISLISLIIGFEANGPHKIFYSVYFFAEYSFGLMFVAGCRYYATGKRVSLADAYLLVLALGLALLLPHLSGDFNDLFMVQATVMAALFATSFGLLRVASRRKGPSPGLRIMSTALLLLTIDFLHYVPAFGSRNGFLGFIVPAGYLKYTSIFDLILEILLGFGTVMFLMEGVLRQAEEVNRELVITRDKLELMAKMDPLTEALNRHAFHSILSRGESDRESDVSGCLALIDVDNLKAINDSFGHGMGDKAIRTVARGVRSLIRADDLLFRWGGDEFLVMMFKLEDTEAERRMRTLNHVLAADALPGSAAPLRVRVSFGVAGFDSMTQIGQAIEEADQAMYRKRARERKLKAALHVV